MRVIITNVLLIAATRQASEKLKAHAAFQCLVTINTTTASQSEYPQPSSAASSPSPSSSYDRLKLFEEMERQFDSRSEDYFKGLLTHHDSIVRTRAVCILADIAGENAVGPIGGVLEKDDNALVRHEAAFSLGQLGLTSGIGALAKAVERDPSFFVRHEAAVALGVIGSEEARKTLDDALHDESEEVRESAMVALANLDYIKATQKNTKFTKMTGG